MTTTQPTFNQVFDLACMLPISEQQMLLDQVRGNLVNHLSEGEGITDVQKARLREAYRQAMSGEYYSQEESDAVMDEIVEEFFCIS